MTTNKITTLSAFSNTSGKQMLHRSFNHPVTFKLVENYHGSNSRILVTNTDTDEIVFIFDFNPESVSIVQDFSYFSV